MVVYGDSWTEAPAGIKRSSKWMGKKIPRVLKVLRVLGRWIKGTVGLIVLITLTVLTYPPIFLWRCFAITTGKWIMGYGKMFSGYDVVTCMDSKEANGGTPRSPIVQTAVLKGNMSLEEVRRLFSEKVLSAELKSKPGRIRYPELKQYEEKWLGYRFLKNCPDFRIEEYVEECTDPLSLREIHQNLMNQRFHQGKSPWKLVIFPNAVPGHVVLGFRIYHSIADGLSTLKLFVECLGGKSLKKAKTREVKRSLLGEIVHKVKLPVSLGNDYVNIWIDAVREYWSEKLLKRKPTPGEEGAAVLGLTEPISMADVKVVAKLAGVTSSAVIMAGLLGGLENFVRKIFDSTEKKEISLGYVLPLKRHPETLANHWSTTYTTVKFGKSQFSSPVERLKCYNDAFTEMKTSSRRIFCKYSTWLICTAFVKLAKLLSANNVCSIGITNMAGDEEGFQIEGRECVEFSSSAGGLSGIDLLFCLMSYKGEFRVSCMSEKSIMGEDEVVLLSEFVRDEFHHLFHEIKGNRNEGKINLISNFNGSAKC